MTEADTCRKFVVSLLQAAGWDDNLHAEQRYFTAGRLVSQGQTARRLPGKRADCLLRYTQDLPLAVAEAKAAYRPPTDGKHLRVVKLADYTAEKVRTLCPGLEDLRTRWADSAQRAEIIDQMAERGVDSQTVAAQAGKPDAGPFDLLCHLAFVAPVLTRRQRADHLKKQKAAFFAYYAPEAREILNDLLEKYAADGELQFTLPDVLKVPPLSSHGNVNEIMGRFGGANNLRDAVNQLEALLYTQ
jgi:type I site-specific restriction endonuclease